MGNKIAIQVENLSKAYQIGQIGTGTISRDLERFWATKIRGKEDPFLKIGQTNDRTIKGESDIVWSLQDLNFEIEKGDAIGIIGRNGAGKSTLLKLLSRVTAPTKGTMKVKGRIASLLEVGTGFHPELTGRENVFLNGAILGMRKKEISSKFEEIVDFSGIERYIDTPVKRYSSGMYVRLAFAVAAHLESEILIVDEVLAVGDLEFQKKCLGKMNEVSIGDGRTILFVSHDLNSIEKLCKKGIMLQNGKISQFGTVNDVIQGYLGMSYSYNREEFKPEDGFVKRIRLNRSNNQIKTGDDLQIEIEFSDGNLPNEINIGVYHLNGEKLLHLSSKNLLFTIESKSIMCVVPRLGLLPARYSINLECRYAYSSRKLYSECLIFKVEQGCFFPEILITEKDKTKLIVNHFFNNI